MFEPLNLSYYHFPAWKAKLDPGACAQNERDIHDLGITDHDSATVRDVKGLFDAKKIDRQAIAHSQ
jgi:hypothetical protein